MNNTILATQIDDFRCCFGVQNQRKFALNNSRKFALFLIQIYSSFLDNFGTENQAVREECMALLSVMLNVFALCELFKTTVNYNSF